MTNNLRLSDKSIELLCTMFGLNKCLKIIHADVFEENRVYFCEKYKEYMFSPDDYCVACPKWIKAHENVAKYYCMLDWQPKRYKKDIDNA